LIPNFPVNNKPDYLNVKPGKKKSFKINGFFQRQKKYVYSFGIFSKENKLLRINDEIRIV